MSYLDKLPENLREPVAKRVKEYPKLWKGGVCAFTIFNKKTGMAEDSYGSESYGVCHAGITYIIDPSVIVNAHKKMWSKTNPEFLLWVAKESPFHLGVLNRDEPEELFNHASVIDTEIVGKGGALWLCKAWRHFEEDAFKLKTWSKLREQGLDGLQAFIGSDILTSKGGPAHFNTHVGLFAYADPKSLRKIYDTIRNSSRIDTAEASSRGKNNESGWGSLVGEKVKKPDGWGGFIEITLPGNVETYATALKEIFEGDPDNVK